MSAISTFNQPNISVAQEYYKPQKDYDDKSYGDGGDYYSNSYDKGYDSYDKKEKKTFAELEKFDNKLFVCDNGIVVDDRINCPQKCPFNTPLEGVYVMDLDVCNIQPGVGVVCPLGTDLEGVVVTSESQCNIFFECDATTPLGIALAGQDVKVADAALCELNVPSLQVCQSGPFEGFVVTEEDVCDAMEGVQVCAPGTDLQGMLTTNPLTCNIFEECVTGDPIFSAIPGGDSPFQVVDDQICQLTVPPGVTLFNCGQDTENPGAIVTDEQLCDAPGDGNICPLNTDLPGVYVANINTQCNIFEQCITGDPIFDALPGGDAPFDVVDNQICQLTVGDGTCPNCNLVFEVCGPGTDLEGAYVEDVDTDCDVEGLATFVCPAGTNLAGEDVTNLELCDLVSEDLKTCNTCLLVGVEGVEGRQDTTNVLSGINQFTNNEEQGPESLCGLKDQALIDSYNEIVDDNVIGLINQNNAKALFSNCLTGSDLRVIVNLDLAIPNRDTDNDVSILLGNGDGTFDPKTDFPTGERPEYIAVADFNGDSNLDLAVANREGVDVSILLGNGDGTFDPKTDFPTGNEPWSIAVGSFNSNTDNFLDLAVTNRLDNDVSILLGNGDGTFDPKTDFDTGIGPESVALGSFNPNTDNFLDLAVANDGQPVVSILLGNGDGTFDPKTDFGAGGNSHDVVVGHFNADSDLDLAVAHFGISQISILLGNGDGTFDPKTDFPIGLGSISIAVADFNGDSNLDLAVANFFDNDVSILLGNGDGTFDPKTDFPAGNGAVFVAVGEFNADSDLDLAVANLRDNDVSILLGNGDGTFDPKTDFPTGNAPVSIGVGEFN